MILLVDSLFPSKYAKWRIEGIKAFVDEGDCDILVSKIDSFLGIDYHVDYEEMREYYNLNDYNILIFDPKFNYLNKYNTHLDGTKFNNTIKNYSYIFTKNTSFDLNNYDNIYHIFLSNYNLFNKTFDNVSDHKQSIHLYPGGGFGHETHLTDLNKSIRIISTQPFITSMLKRHKFRNFIEAYGSTILPKDFKIRQKQIKSKNLPLGVCFSNMGNATSKGYDYYVNSINAYNRIAKHSPINWYYVGNSTQIVKRHPNITYLPPMSQSELEDFYYNKIDVLINSETGKTLNGFPLGIEAAIQGVILFTTDPHRSNTYFKYTNRMCYFLDGVSPLNAATRLKNLHINRKDLNNISLSIQNHSVNLFNYDKQQKRIISFVKRERDKTLLQSAMEKYLIVCPDTNYIDHVFELNDNKRFDVRTNNFREIIKNSITHNKPLTMARYNDGEWFSLLKIDYNNFYNSHFKKLINNHGEKFVADKMKPIIQSKPSYYIGLSSECIQKPYIINHIYPFIKDLKLVDGGLFAKWSIDNYMDDLLDILQDKSIIIVGPEYLNDLSSYFKDLQVIDTIDHKHSWLHYEELHQTLSETIQQSSSKTPIILYCASLVAKVLIDDMYHKFDNIIQLDIGAAFDPYCGIDSRPWHEDLISYGNGK